MCRMKPTAAAMILEVDHGKSQEDTTTPESTTPDQIHSFHVIMPHKAHSSKVEILFASL